jgi:hypothetical protein
MTVLKTPLTPYNEGFLDGVNSVANSALKGIQALIESEEWRQVEKHWPLTNRQVERLRNAIKALVSPTNDPRRP